MKWQTADFGVALTAAARQHTRKFFAANIAAGSVPLPVDGVDR